MVICHKLADIKPDNIMIGLGRHWTTDAIDNRVMKNAPSTHAPERSLNKMVSVYISQSFPPPTLENPLEHPLSFPKLQALDFIPARQSLGRPRFYPSCIGLQTLCWSRQSGIDIFTLIKPGH